jgi:hypothetical protein
MFRMFCRLTPFVVLLGLFVYCTDPSDSQEPAPYQPAAAAAEPGKDIPKGMEVMARGPIHEAFAMPMTEPKQTPGIPKKPPLPIDEMPPAEKPEGDSLWVGGYWSWNDDKADYLWVSGCWRVKPVGKEWVPGYWREVGDVWQWVSGFWTTVTAEKAEAITYNPAPPAPPNVAPAGDPPAADTFYIPGYWMWSGDRYVWRAGYWTRVRAGYVYIPSHYRWTPSGYVFIPGYWDLQVSRRGLLYTPVVVDPVLVQAGYVYTPYYAVRDTVVLDTLFVRPAFGAYYFGDYYGPRYVSIGFESGVVYSQRYYEPLIVYERYERRDNPAWFNLQLTLVVDRGAGRAPLPPRVVNVTNITVVNNIVAPGRTVMAARGEKFVAMSPAARAQVRENARAVHQALAAERHKQESRGAGPPAHPQASALAVHPTTASGAHAPLAPAGSKVSATEASKTASPGASALDKKGAAPMPAAKDSKKAPPEKKKMP